MRSRRRPMNRSGIANHRIGAWSQYLAWAALAQELITRTRRSLHLSDVPLVSDVPLSIRAQHEPAAAGKEFVCVTIAFTLSNLALQPPEKK
jgi:hypothetical protein